MSGHESEKFCRYMTWQRMENAIFCAGSESVITSKTCIAMMAWPQTGISTTYMQSQPLEQGAQIYRHVSALRSRT